jgi:hypothetical protein
MKSTTGTERPCTNNREGKVIPATNTPGTVTIPQENELLTQKSTGFV